MRACTFIIGSILVLCMVPYPCIGQINFNSTDQSSLYSSADSAILANEFGEIHSLVIIQDGNLQYERYYYGWHKDSLHQLQSATKSIISALYGCALEQGMVKGPGELINSHFPEFVPADPLHQSIRTKDLLTQQHGLKWKEAQWEDPENTWRKVLESDGDWYQLILETPMDTAPGTEFNYSNAAPVLTTGIIQQASGMNIQDFAAKYLFNPLGISEVNYWQGNGGPENNGMAMIWLKPRDMAKIGQLFLQEGTWKDRTILPRDYVLESTAALLRKVESNWFYDSFDYGYFWWRNPVRKGKSEAEEPEIFLARGAGGQNIIIWPEKQMVVVITAWNIQMSSKPLRIFHDYIVPAVP